MKILIDTGTAKNYIKNIPCLKAISNDKPFKVKTLNGENRITKKCKIRFCDIITDFFVLPELKTFDAIIGYDFLVQIKAQIDTERSLLIYENGCIQIKFFECEQVNNLEIDTGTIPEAVKKEFQKLIEDFSDVFAQPDEKLPFNTNIKAAIRTINTEPIYSKPRPYNMAAIPFVNKEIKRLLDDGIIRPSHSPYNTPILVVGKKGVNEDGSPKYRLVFDYRKLNGITISDRYPIPESSVILSNLGNAKFYSTIDLKSGFHQILLEEKDREKTAFSINNGKYEFCRLPFGLKNGPSIFQRAIDNVLRNDIGKRCQSI